MTSRTSTSLHRACEFCGRELRTREFTPFGMRPVTITIPCDCEQSRQAAERAEVEAEMRERRDALAEVWFRSGVPRRFLHVKADKDKAAPLFEGRWLYICGENGRGKTHSACQAAKSYLIRNTKRDVIPTKRGDRKGPMRCRVSFHFTEAQSLLSEVTSSWSRWDMNEAEVKERWAGVDLLILDDLGKGVPSEWAAETIFDIINRRWADNQDQEKGKNKPRLTIITSQYGIDDLADRYRKAGAETLSAMMSRLKGECEETRLGGPDRRIRNP